MYEDFLKSPTIYERKRTFVMEQDTKVSFFFCIILKIPVIGKVSANVDLVDKLYLISPTHIHIEFLSKVTGAMYADHFDIIQAKSFTQHKNSVHFS